MAGLVRELSSSRNREVMLKADGTAVKKHGLQTAMKLVSLELSCSVACKAGSNCLRFGSPSNGDMGDCGTGDTGIVEADVGGAGVAFSLEEEDWEELCKNVIQTSLLIDSPFSVQGW